jgi:hypothetical protein
VGWGGTVPAFRQVFSSLYIPSAGEEQKRWYDELQQASSSGETAARLWESRNRTDISETARRVTRPALVLHGRHDGAVPNEEGRRLASLLPDARFVRLESDSHVLQEGEPAWERFLSEVRAFLGDDERAHTLPTDLSELSKREHEVLNLVAAGMSNEEIGERLFVSTPPSSATSRTCTSTCGYPASPHAPPQLRDSHEPDTRQRIAARRTQPTRRNPRSNGVLDARKHSHPLTNRDGCSSDAPGKDNFLGLARRSPSGGLRL